LESPIFQLWLSHLFGSPRIPYVLKTIRGLWFHKSRLERLWPPQVPRQT